MAEPAPERPRLIAPFTPLPWQLAPWRDLSPVVLLTGSGGGGKSTVAAEKVHAFAKKYPGATCLILRKNREAMTNSTILFFERFVVGADPSVRHLKSSHRFEYDNGSIVAYGGMADQAQREQIRSIGQSGGLDMCWMEEATAFVEDDFNELLARMRGRAAPWRQIVLSTNPGAPSHWIYQRLIEKGEAKVYYSRAADNTHNPADYETNLGKISGTLGLRLREGKWVAAEGVVYDAWDRAIHVIPRFDIPPTWRRIRVIDFGFSNPFVCGWIAEDPDGRAILYREIYKTRRIVEDHARHIRKLSEGERIEATLADHDAEDIATLQRHGIYARPAHKALIPGIQAVQARLRVQEDGKPRLYYMEGALVERDEELVNLKRPWSTDQEFEAYSWPKGADGRAVKEAPLKEHDHGMDMVRYGVAYLDRLAGSSLAQQADKIGRLADQLKRSPADDDGGPLGGGGWGGDDFGGPDFGF